MYQRRWILDKTWDNGLTWRYTTADKIRGAHVSTNVVYIKQEKGVSPPRGISDVDIDMAHRLIRRGHE